jgi:hypothetical protein
MSSVSFSADCAKAAALMIAKRMETKANFLIKSPE